MSLLASWSAGFRPDVPGDVETNTKHGRNAMFVKQWEKDGVRHIGCADLHTWAATGLCGEIGPADSIALEEAEECRFVCDACLGEAVARSLMKAGTHVVPNDGDDIALRNILRTIRKD